MVDFATLVLSADTRQLKTAVTDLKAVADAGAKTEAQTGKTGLAITGMGAAANTATAPIGRFRDANGRFIKAGTEAHAAAVAAAKGFDVQGVAAAQATAGMHTMAGAAGALVGRLAAVAGAALSIRAIAGAADQWSDLQSVVGAAIKDMEAAPVVMQEINRLARASYSSLSQTAEGFARNVQTLRDLGYSTQGALDYTEALNNALVITATRGQRAASVQDALSKAMATGKLQADGLETVLSNGGRVAEALAAELGTTVSGLRQMATDGKITGDVIARALTGRLEELREEAGRMPATMADGFGQIANSFTVFIGVMDKASGASSSVADILIMVADNFKMVVGYATAAALGITGLYIPAIYGAITGAKLFGASLVSLKGALIATGIGAFIVIAGTLIGKFLELVQATGSFGSALAAMGELGGLVWEGLVASAAAIPPGLSAIWGAIKADFYGMIATLQQAWYMFLGSVSFGLRNFGMDAAADNVGEAARNAGLAWDEVDGKRQAALDEATTQAEAAAGIIKDAFAPVGAAWERLNSTVAAGLDTPGTPTLPGTDPGAGGGGAKGAAAKSETQKQAEAATEALSKLRQEYTDLSATIGMTAEEERVYQAVQELGTGATAAQVAEVQRLIPEIDALKAAKERLAQVAQNGKQALDNLFGGVIDGSKSAKDAVLDLIAQIGRVQIMNGIFALPGMGGVASTLGELLTPTGLPGRANGGPVSAGHPYMVGERGAEPFVPAVNGRILSVSEAQGAIGAGGAAITYAPTYNISATSDASLSRLEQMMAQDRASFGQRVQKAIARPRG